MKTIKLKKFLNMCLLTNLKIQVIERHGKGKNILLLENKSIEEVLRENSYLKRIVSCWSVEPYKPNEMSIWVFPDGIKTPEELLQDDIHRFENKLYPFDN